MSRLRSPKITYILVSLMLALVACGGGTSNASRQAPVILMNWFAQAEQGGYWDAQSNQYSESKGIKITLKQGGPGLLPIPQVAAGEATFGIANADAILVARKNGLPVVALAAPLDTSIQCLMYHKGQGIDGISDLNGKMVARVPTPYWDYLKKRYSLTDVKDVNYTGSMAEFKRNKDLVQQCFITAEPYAAKNAKIEDVAYFSVAKDGGYNPYGNVLFTTEAVLKDDPDMVGAVVDAVIKGWTAFKSDPSDAKSATLKANKDADAAGFDFAAETLANGGYIGNPVGNMTNQRWQKLRDQLASVGLVSKDLEYQKAFTTKFLPAANG